MHSRIFKGEPARSSCFPLTVPLLSPAQLFFHNQSSNLLCVPTKRCPEQLAPHRTPGTRVRAKHLCLRVLVHKIFSGWMFALNTRLSAPHILSIVTELFAEAPEREAARGKRPHEEFQFEQLELGTVRKRWNPNLFMLSVGKPTKWHKQFCLQ